MYQYKILEIRYTGRLSSEIDVPKLEKSLNAYGNKGWRLKEIHGISTNGYAYMENSSEDSTKYQYRIIERTMSFGTSLKIRENESNMNQLAQQGFRLMKLFNSTDNLYYYFEKMID